MDKNILILEPSQTLRTFIAAKLGSIASFNLDFVADGMDFLREVCDGSAPDILLVNANARNPEVTELLRLMRTLDKCKAIPVGMYSVADFHFMQFYAKYSCADSFFAFDDDRYKKEIEYLLSLSDSKESPARLNKNDLIKSAITQHSFATLRHIDSIERLSENILNIVAEFSECPAVALYFLDGTRPVASYMCSGKFTKAETEDFLKVCSADFEGIVPDISISGIEARRFRPGKSLDSYRSGSIPLSSYQGIKLTSTKNKPFGLICVVKEGNFTNDQIDLLSFCAWRISLILEDSIIIKQKNEMEKKIRKAFGRFVPEQIINDLVKETDAKDNMAVGEKRKVAVLFSDIRSFTNISERNKPEVIVAFLNRYFTIMVNVIKKHGGTIDKFIGDAIMALFGAPVSYDENCRRAVAAAYEMREALSQVSLEDLVLPEGMDFNIGIGIHYGDVIVGSIGSADKTDYSVIGDTVNLASRLEGLTKTYGSMILVSDSVKKDLGDNPDSFIFRYLDNVKVKGKAKPVPIFAVDRSMEDFSPLYRDSYEKGLALYQQGTWKLAKEYFAKAAAEKSDDKAARLMLERCSQFVENPPENWDGAITFTTK